MARDLGRFQFTENSDNATSSQGWSVSCGEIINTLAGDDKIEGFNNETPGINNEGKIYTGNGDDKIIAESISSAIFNKGLIDTGYGSDTIIAKGTANATKNVVAAAAQGHVKGIIHASKIIPAKIAKPIAQIVINAPKNDFIAMYVPKNV